jgi:4-methyl-5(b-hydroxyethyl)-thiazole monophosphate biosynthesis
MKRVAVLLADGFEEVEGLTQVDFLRRAGIEVTVAGVTGSRVTGGHDIRIDTDTPVEQLNGEFDGVVIPGGMPGAENVAASSAANDFIRRVFEQGGLVGAICAAPAVVLEPLGILKGRKATCFPGFEQRFKEAEFVTDRVVEQGNIITSRGPATAGEFAVALVRYLAGDEAADELWKRTLQPLIFGA